jgi:hypothetical protein
MCPENHSEHENMHDGIAGHPSQRAGNAAPYPRATFDASERLHAAERCMHDKGHACWLESRRYAARRALTREHNADPYA